MAQAATDKLMKVGAATITSLASPGKALAASSINVDATTNWPTDTGKVISIWQQELVDGEYVLVSGTYTEWACTHSGTTVNNLDLVYGTDQVYPAGTNTKVAIKDSAARYNRMIDGLLVGHNQDGSFKATAIQTALGITGTTPADYTTLPQNPATVVANGNRSYSLTFTGVDLRPTLNPGYRLGTTRTVAAPTQSTSLNGTTQYWNDTTVSGMTFTDDFVVGAWVKLSSYAQGAVIGRYNGTSGWALRVNSTGQLVMFGNNAGGSNNSYVQSYQSIPLNKWVHIAAQLDMSAFTASSTTSYMMIDGVDVPCLVARGGTNPTSLIQAGDLQVGADQSANFFPGKIAQAFVSSAKITQANVRTLISQGLTSALITSNSIVSAYSFDGSANDLNTTNANNLTAQGSAVATNADSPFGGQAGGTISSTLDYGIVQSVTYSTDSTVVVQVAEGCTIPTSGGVSAVRYSSAKSPYGFPAETEKWRLTKVILGTTGISTGTTAGWQPFTGTDLLAPVGKWIYSDELILTGQYSTTAAIVKFEYQTDITTPTGHGDKGIYSRTTHRVYGNDSYNLTTRRTNNVLFEMATATTLKLYGVNAGGVMAGSGFYIEQAPGFMMLDNAYL